MFKLIFVTVFTFYVVIQFIDGAPTSVPSQNLPLKEGYIPVYIREGDTPLTDINVKLAEAFHENDSIGKDIEEVIIEKQAASFEGPNEQPAKIKLTTIESPENEKKPSLPAEINEESFIDKRSIDHEIDHAPALLGIDDVISKKVPSLQDDDDDDDEDYEYYYDYVAKHSNKKAIKRSTIAKSDKKEDKPSPKNHQDSSDESYSSEDKKVQETGSKHHQAKRSLTEDSHSDESKSSSEEHKHHDHHHEHEHKPKDHKHSHRKRSVTVDSNSDESKSSSEEHKKTTQEQKDKEKVQETGSKHHQAKRSLTEDSHSDESKSSSEEHKNHDHHHEHEHKPKDHKHSHRKRSVTVDSNSDESKSSSEEHKKTTQEQKDKEKVQETGSKHHQAKRSLTEDSHSDESKSSSEEHKNHDHHHEHEHKPKDHKHSHRKRNVTVDSNSDESKSSSEEHKKPTQEQKEKEHIHNQVKRNIDIVAFQSKPIISKIPKSVNVKIENSSEKNPEDFKSLHLFEEKENQHKQDDGKCENDCIENQDYQ